VGVPVSAASVLESSVDRPALHSFPTRRSSDLGGLFCGKGGRQASPGASAESQENLGRNRFGVSRLARCSAGVYALGKRASLSPEDRKSTRLNSSHGSISYAVFCLKNKLKRHKN